MMEEKPAHSAALKSTALVWVTLILMIAIGAIVRATSQGEAVIEKAMPKDNNVVAIQRNEEPPVEPALKRETEETAQLPKTTVQQPVEATEPAQKPKAQYSPSTRTNLDEQPTRDTSPVVTPSQELKTPASTISIQASGTDDIRAQLDAIAAARGQSDFRRNMSYYTQIGETVPEAQRRWARIDIRIDDAYWQASAAFGIRFVFMAGDYDTQNEAYEFDVSTGDIRSLAAATLNEHSWVVRELVGNASRTRTARQNAAAKLKLTLAEDVRIFSLIPENIWTAQLGKIEDVLVRTNRLRLRDVSRVSVGYETHGPDFDFVVTSIIKSDGNEQIVSLTENRR
jgi:hypothetical protein